MRVYLSKASRFGVPLQEYFLFISSMKKILDYVLSAVYLLYFGLILVVFHVMQVVAYRFLGRKAHKKTVDWLNFSIAYGWLLTGSTIHFRMQTTLPVGRPIIFVANHQSMFDIPGIIWFLRDYTPTFVSKIELAKGIPSISYNLRKSGAALIDRADGKRAVVEIAKLGKLIQEQRISAVIFPEGTRSKTGDLKPFAIGGVSTLLKKAPDALLVPIAIQGTRRFNPKGIFPLRSFSQMSWTVLPGIEPSSRPVEEVVQQAQDQIWAELSAN